MEEVETGIAAYCKQKHVLRYVGTEDEPLAELDFAGWEGADGGRGWARAYVNACFGKRVNTNSRVLKELIKMDDVDEAALPREWDFGGVNYCGRHGLGPIAVVVALWRGLRCIKLARCGVDSQGLADLLAVAARHPSLSSIDVSHNRMFAGAGRPICSLLAANPRITHFDVTGNEIPEKYLVKIAALLERNRNIQNPPPPPPPIDAPPELFPLLGRTSVVLEVDGFTPAATAVAPHVLPLSLGAAALHAELDDYRVRFADAIHAQQPPVLAREMDRLKTLVGADDDGVPSARLLNAHTHDTITLYGHVRRSVAQVARETAFGTRCADIASALETWLRTDRKRSRVLPRLCDRVKYHMIMRGGRANGVVQTWLSIAGRNNLPPPQTLLHTEYRKAYAAGEKRSEYAGQEYDGRDEVLAEIRRVFPKVLVDYLMHLFLLYIMAANPEPLRLLHRDIRARPATATPPSEFDLPKNTAHRDYLAHVYNFLASQASDTSKAEDVRAWLLVQPEAAVDAYAAALPLEPPKAEAETAPWAS